MVILHCVGCFHHTKNPAHSHHEFRDAASLLAQLAGENGLHPSNHFYVSAVNLVGTRDEFTWVYWKEERLLIMWNPFYRDQWRLSLCKTWNLTTDVVSSEAELHGSNYLLTQEWARAIVRQCESGDRYVIARNPIQSSGPAGSALSVF